MRLPWCSSKPFDPFDDARFGYIPAQMAAATNATDEPLRLARSQLAADRIPELRSSSCRRFLPACQRCIAPGFKRKRSQTFGLSDEADHSR
mmetsp:Transcript_27429/g.66139  ORF Transcript_27429/g.66139 Transcript_27429/m.66139 type:complete len:91 (+) Transcript_27429:618-890(+)